MRPAITVDAIVAAVAEASGVPVTAITGRVATGPDRHDAGLVPRQAAMWLAVQLTRLLYGEIGAAIGGRDRKTVRRGAQRVDELIETNADLAGMLDQIKLYLTGEDVALPRVAEIAFRQHATPNIPPRPPKPPAVVAVEAAIAAFNAGAFPALREALHAALAELAPTRARSAGRAS